MPELEQVFLGLPLPSSSSGSDFSVASIPNGGDHKIGKNWNGSACLLIHTEPEGRDRSPSVRLESIVVEHAVSARSTDIQGHTHEGVFSIVILKSNDPDLVAIFLRLGASIAAQLPGRPSVAVAARLIRRLVAIFQTVKRPARETVQGLWGELFVMSLSPDPGRMVTAWHAEPGQRYDFVHGGVRLDVKSASGRVRRHHFSLEQLTPPRSANLWIASLFAEPATGGTTIGDLLALLRERLPQPEHRLRIDEVAFATLGEDWSEGLGASFDYDLAVESLRFVAAEHVPKIDDELPRGVTNVLFCSDLDGTPLLTLNEARSAVAELLST